MDSLTQIVLGASVGEAVLGKKIGNKAILWGAVAGTIPDLDVLSRYFVGTVEQLELHRGFTHSIIFCFLFAPVSGWLLDKLYKKQQVGWKGWTSLMFWGLFTHPLLDCFTTWGTQLFWPLDYRVALKSIFVIDPLYTVPFMALVIWAMFKPKESTIRRKLNTAGLVISSCYLLFTFLNKQVINNIYEKSLSAQNIEHLRFDTRPAPLNNILWVANVETDNGYYIGYYSHLDQNNKIDYQYYNKNHHLLDPFAGSKKIKTLKKITTGYYIVEDLDTSIAMHDLRFGQLFVDNDERNEFVFTYLIREENNDLVVSRKSESTRMKYAAEILDQLWERIKGTKNQE